MIEEDPAAAGRVQVDGESDAEDSVGSAGVEAGVESVTMIPSRTVIPSLNDIRRRSP